MAYGNKEASKGTLILIGGGSRGLGRAILTRYKESGYTAVIMHRRAKNEDADQELFFDIDDACCIEGLSSTLRAVLDHSIGKRVVLHCLSGGSLGIKPENASTADIDRVLRHNVGVPMIVGSTVDVFCKENAEQKASIVLYSSAVVRNYGSTPFYVASKCALEGYFKALVTKAPSNMSCFMMRLGHVDIKHKYFHALKKEKPEVFREYLRKNVPSGHFTDVSEIAGFAWDIVEKQGMFSGMCCDLTGGHSWI